MRLGRNCQLGRAAVLANVDVVGDLVRDGGKNVPLLIAAPRSVPHLTSSHDQLTTADAPATDLAVMYEPNSKHARKR